MSISRSASFTNTDDNVNLIIDGNCPGIVIESIEGIYAFTGQVLTSPYSQTNGDRYKNSRATKRNIVVQGKIYDDFWDNRQLMYRVFRLGSVGRFCYMEPGKDNRYADYYVENVEIDQDPYRGQYQISLICPDPFFYAGKDEYIDLAAWISDFTFEHCFLAEGEEIGHRETSMIKEVENLNGVDGIGMKIILTASGDVTNPYVYLYETGERIAIGTTNNPYTLTSAKRVEIDTTTGKKNIVQIESNVRTRINEYLDPNSSFFQLKAGKNTIGYNAAENVGYMNVHIEYKMRYLGV
jgi:hypothetical protein